MAKTKRATNKVAHGRRYSDAVKKRILDFVEEVNSERGRGGISAAAKKFGASPLSISNWIKESGGTVRSVVRGGSKARDRVLHELTTLNRTIAKRRQELDALEKRFGKLKASL